MNLGAGYNSLKVIIEILFITYALNKWVLTGNHMLLSFAP